MAHTQSKKALAMFVVGGLSLLLAASMTAAADASGCSGCTVSYEPVVDAATGLPFYNECLGRCQLGKGAKLIAVRDGGGGGSSSIAAGQRAAAANSGGTAAASAKQASAASPAAVALGGTVVNPPDYFKLVPRPAAAASDADAAAARPPVVVTPKIMSRFAAEGFYYIGRPVLDTRGGPRSNRASGAVSAGGLFTGDGKLRPDLLAAGMPAAASSPGGASSASRRGAPLSSPSPKPTSPQSSATSEDDKGIKSSPAGAADRPTVSLRMTYPDGDMYMKIWSAQDKKKLVAKYSNPISSPAAAASRSRAAANPPPSATATPAAAAAAATSAAASSNSEPANGPNSSDSSSSTPPSPSNDSRPTGTRRLLKDAYHVIIGKDNRKEITRRPVYPYSAVALMVSNLGVCTGTLIGGTGRLLLTAGHCLYDFDPITGQSLGWAAIVEVAPGFHRGAIAPYGWILGGEVAEVQASWRETGSWAADIGLLQLGYHYPYPGALGYASDCYYGGDNSYSEYYDYYNDENATPNYTLTTAGYPFDKAHGTLWTQVIKNVTVDVCSGTADKYFNFDAAAGQSGSSFWTSEDYSARFVLSNGGDPRGNGAVAITSYYYSWISDFTLKNIMVTRPVILVGGAKENLFVRCDTATWRCAGSKSRSAATRFYAFPFAENNKYALAVAVPGMNLCLTQRAAAGGVSRVDLEYCEARSFTFGPNALWKSIYSDDGAGGTYTPVLRSDSGGYLQWNGTRQLLATRNCESGSWQCNWQLEYADI